MKAVVQRVEYARVCVADKIVGEIDKGLLVLVGVGPDDLVADAQILAEKCSKLRIFTDDDGKMNLSVQAIGGGVLVVSQFTLFADTKKGNRPSFSSGAKPEKANVLYEEVIKCFKTLGIQKVESGVFGEHMKVEFINDGPVTIQYDTKEWLR